MQQVVSNMTKQQVISETDEVGRGRVYFKNLVD